MENWKSSETNSLLVANKRAIELDEKKVLNYVELGADLHGGKFFSQGSIFICKNVFFASFVTENNR